MRRCWKKFRTLRWWWRLVVEVVVVLLLWLLTMTIVVPQQLFDTPYSGVVYSENGTLLGARIARDGQWRFPESDSLSERFVTSLVEYEDHRFYNHVGVDIWALGRAVRDNVSQWKVVSGGSTLTMQLARIARGNRPRTIYNKVVEMSWALYLELRYSKERILSLYAAHAPFGGNTVGVEAAAWRYFGRSVHNLSWSEAALLAVLPNSPALIHLSRGREQLLEKRNALLEKLYQKGHIDSLEYELSLVEPLPDAPEPLPDLAPHLTERIVREYPQKSVRTTISVPLQRRLQQIVDTRARENSANYVGNMAAVIAEVETGNVVAYVGNVSWQGTQESGNSVDIVTASRSTGSILKPFLYAGMMTDGMLLPNELVPDVPLYMEGFTPENYNKTFYGAVPASEAIVRSLNVPLVRMLSRYNVGRFMELLESLGMTTLRFSEGHYGASLILGGGEATLWDLGGMYASMARQLKHFGRYNPLRLVAVEDKPIESVADDRLGTENPLSASSIWFTFEAMSALNRPEEEADWQSFSSSQRIAWKTGTSYGGRDAWAVGVTSRYVVAVWAGNASGEGRAGLSGVGMAAPALFDIFSSLGGARWFDEPLDDMELIAVCRASGAKASDVCPEIDTLRQPRSGVSAAICSYHRRIYLSPDEQWRVNGSCSSVSDMVARSWFVLPPAQEYYYRRHHPEYQPMPPLRADCRSADSHAIDIIFPEQGAVLYLPRGFSGERERFIFSAATTSETEALYWYVDARYVGTTRPPEHKLAIGIESGLHRLTLTDSRGNRREVTFSVK